VVIRRLCTFLEIPEELWIGYESFAVRQPIEPATTSLQYVAVAGIMGSGKTTLAKVLAPMLQLTLLPENPRALQYLPDLRGDSQRWAFETQLAFLSHKATRIAGFLADGRGFVVDRTLEEDVDIFATHFYEEGDITPRAYQTYRTLADHFLATLEPPELIIYCDCDVNTAYDRVARRARQDSGLHSLDHLKKIQERYEKWIDSIRGSAVYRLDSERLNWTNRSIAEAIARDVDTAGQLRNREPHLQLDLFAANQRHDRPGLSMLEQIQNAPLPAWRRSSPLVSSPIPVLPYPSVYIAAPFTAIAGAPSPSSKKRSLFTDDAPHGQIRKGPYRRALLGLSRVLSQMGFNPLLPHRDVNRWGKRTLRAEDVMRLCTHHVQAADLFVGLLGGSHGSHYEFGLARGMGKPCVIIHADDVRDSFMAEGLSTSSNSGSMLVIKVDAMKHVPEAIGSEPVRQFLLGHFGAVLG
jgi:deoxyadenosine/deoxycytidine kinase